MSPTPQEHGMVPETEVAQPLDGERVVISGMTGLYPQSEFIKDLEKMLYNKVNPISEHFSRWNFNHPEVARQVGNVPDLEYFDAQYFSIHYWLGQSMDVMERKLLEQAYQAIYDAGVSPKHLWGKKIGVYIGSSHSESEKLAFYNFTSRYALLGCNKTMFANYISYWLNLKGPSLSFDEACCSSTVALEQAYLAICRGDCEAAIVGGANLFLHPHTSIHYGRALPLSEDGKTRSFDENAAGCALSEAINVIFLQKAKDALRIYADVIHVKCQFASKLGEGSVSKFLRDPNESAIFLNKFYKEAGVLPNAVEYVEAFGSAEMDADKAELETFDKVFCLEKKEPTLIGSVTSNIGYSSAASGLSSVTKVLLGYHRGELAGTLHCENPRNDVAALREGRMRIVQDNTRFKRTYAAVNSLSLTGVNGHILLHGHYKPKNLDRYKSNIPYLVTLSGRTDSSLNKVFEELKSHPIDAEAIAMLHNIHETKIAGHLGRGYIILDTNKDQKIESLPQKADYYDDVRRPLWFVYSGMGSQWAGMGAELMRIPVFAAAIDRCRQALEPKGIDIVHIITSGDKFTFNNILNSFVGIAAIQIGLTDILHELGLVPDNIIGHSVGELGCAYADGCLTAEETILAAYSRGLVSVETPFICGSMAALGMGFQEISKICPPEIEVACHNGPDSSTISGPADAMRDFVADLSSKGVFAKEVPCSNIAYHSRYIKEAGPGLLKYLKEVIKSPKPRSERWVSTSVPQEKWDDPAAKYCSAEYHTNNLLRPVLFEETSRLIPSNAVLVEIAPHGLLQAILKRSLPESCTNIALTRRWHSDNVVLVLDAVGKLYLEGYIPKVKELYLKVEFPVSTGTPFLSHLVDWVHDDKWNVAMYMSADKRIAASSDFLISVYDDEHMYLKGHVTRNKTVLPFSFALVAAWDTLAMSVSIPKKMSVNFHNVQFYAQPILHEHRNNKISVSLQKGNGYFEVMNEDSRVATGFITYIEANNIQNETPFSYSEDEFELNGDDVYQMLRERDFKYSGEFRSITRVNEDLTKADLLWNENWVTLIDGIIQLNALKHPHKYVSQPDLILGITIDVEQHLKSVVTKMDGTTIIKTLLSDVHNYTRCGGILMENIRFLDLPQLNENQITLNGQRFIPWFHSDIDISTSLRVMLQIVSENNNKSIINVIELTRYTDSKTSGMIKHIKEVHNIPGITIQYRQQQKDIDQSIEDADLVVVQNLSKDDDIYQFLNRKLSGNTFVINEEQNVDDEYRSRPSALYNVVCLSNNKDQRMRLELARWKPNSRTIATTYFTVRSESDLPILAATRDKLAPQNCLIILTSYPPVEGLKDLVKQWRKDITRSDIRLTMMSDLDQSPVADLAFNIFEKGVWGGEYYLTLKGTPTMDCNRMLQSERIGDFNSLQWVNVSQPRKTRNVVRIHYASLNINDVNRAAGADPFKNMEYFSGDGYGMDFSGLTESGQKVMGLVKNGAASSQVVAQPELMWPVPPNWSLEDAATVPSAYVYAYYCLHIKADIQVEKDVTRLSVLVHGGSGAMGQAVISIALARGYRVLTTVSDRQKKIFLMRLFPELKEEDIGNSRDGNFDNMVMNATDGRGCDIVFCCLRGELKNVSLKCSAFFGTTFDTVLINSKENYQFGLNCLTLARCYIPVDITSVFKHVTREELKTLQMLITEGIASGEVRPLSRVTFAPHEAPRAFRLLAGSRHRGRVLLRLCDSLPPSQPRLDLSQDSSQLLICDTPHLGLQLADTLIDRGAKKLHIHVITKPTSYLRYRLSQWEKLNIEVSISFEALKDHHDTSRLITNAMCSAPIEGVYVIANGLLNNSVILTLDIATRKLCPLLKYFVVLSNDGSTGRNTCILRARDELPAKMLDLSLLQTLHVEDASTWYKGATETIDRVHHISDTILLAQPLRSPRLPLLQEIAAIADIKLTNSTPNDVTFRDLGVGSENSHIICALLRNVHHISLYEEDILELTINKIKQMEEQTLAIEIKDIKGLESFFSFVDPDELRATTEIVIMPTITNSDTKGNEIDPNEVYLCIVPGLEGHHERFRTLCERLKLPAFVLQPGLDHPHETPQELAQRYTEILVKKIGLKNKFYILGYEAGVITALELAAILEERGQLGIVYCIGDGPEEMGTLIEAKLRGFDTEEALQTAVAQHMFSMMARGNAALAESALRDCSSWSQRVELCVRTLLGRVSYSTQYARALIDTAYARLATARSYSVEPRALRSRLVLMRTQRPAMDATPASCSLQQYSQQPIVLHELAVPLVGATRDLRCAGIINRYLDKDELQVFDSKNLCKCYIIKSSEFETL